MPRMEEWRAARRVVGVWGRGDTRVEEVREVVLRFMPGQEPEEALAEAVGALGAALGVPVALLDKAVPTHHSQFMQRTPGGKFARAHHARVTPRDARGRFRQRLDRGECREAANLAAGYVRELGERLQDHLTLRRAGAIDPPTWARYCERDIQHFYELAYRCGKQSVGDPAVRLTSQDRAVIGRLVRDEADYLRAFGADMDAGRGKMGYAERMALYGDAAREAFWLGWALGDQRRGRESRWMRGPTRESCADCLRFEAMGWVPVARFIAEVIARGYAPQSGQLACQGHNCLCRLEERLAGVAQAPLDPFGA